MLVGFALVNGAGRGQCRSHCAFDKGVYQHLLKIVGTGTHRVQLGGVKGMRFPPTLRGNGRIKSCENRTS